MLVVFLHPVSNSGKPGPEQSHNRRVHALRQVLPFLSPFYHMDLDERVLQMTLRLCAVVTLKNAYRHFSAESFGRRKQPPFFDGDLERFNSKSSRIS
jgi:hypothetical protein